MTKGMEKSCSEEIMKALCECAEQLRLSNKIERTLLLSQTIENLSRSLEILKGIKEGDSSE